MSIFTNLRQLFRSPSGAQVQIQPNVCVDFQITNERVLLLIQNFSSQAAHDVHILFSRDFTILGEKKLSELSVFSKLRYLAPGKEIEIYLDPVGRFFAQLEEKDTLVEVNIHYQDDRQKKYQQRLTHDLAIYQDLPTLINT